VRQRSGAFRKLAIGSLVLLAAASEPGSRASVLAAPPPAKAAAHVVIAYVFPKDGLIDPSTLDATKITHVNYAFANIAAGRVVEGFARDKENYEVLAGLRRRHPHLKVLVSVGGWTWSKAFSDAALTAASRRVFVESAVAFVQRHDLDGFDVDWEYPGMVGDGNVFRPEDKENFTVLMADLREALDRAGKAMKRPLLLTFAAGASSEFLEHTEMAKVQASVDFVNLMTYDFRVASEGGEAGHHANLYPSPDDPHQASADRGVREFLAAGVPPEKLVLGVPFYGRAWSVASDERRGLYQPGKAPAERIETGYASLAARCIGKGGFERVWDEKAQAPYLWNAEKRIFISYEDPESLRVKSRYIREQGLAGAMFWEYYADPSGVLVGTLAEELLK
jgi:chitinase